jgi:catechol 2,3-dioxygenase-like lactoylglutathione lyase family enzyme
MKVPSTPTVTRVLETGLYVEDVGRAVSFYRDVLGLRVLLTGDRLAALDAGQSTVLLLFRRGGTTEWLTTPHGSIPPHDGSGSSHFAFAIPAADLSRWEAHLHSHGIDIEARMEWSGGGHSIYFRDPDGHSVELATPGVWETY